MVLVARAAVVHTGLLAVVSVVRSLRGYNSHPAVHEVIVHGCSRAGCNREEVLEADRSSHLALALHIGHELEIVGDSSYLPAVRLGSVVASA
jgi:hypothetical protein